MATIGTTQLRQGPNPPSNLTGRPPMSRQAANPVDNLSGNPAMSRQAPNTVAVSNLSGLPPMLRQEPDSVKSSAGSITDTMIRQDAPASSQLPGLDRMVRYNGSTTAEPPAEGPFELPPDTSTGSQLRMSQPITKTILRNYQHASRIFIDGQYRLSPKYGWLFYVEFDFNPGITEISNRAAQELGMIVKSVSLPKYSIDVKVHNAYNRKNIVQNRISYDPISIVFHDDQADNVKQFWYDYYSFFYRDPDYADATYQAAHKYDRRASFDWGYTPRPTVGYNTYNTIQPYQYIQAIRIYSIYQGQFSEYELINPVITTFKHGELANGSTETLQSEMTVQFETVKYLEGTVTPNTAGGFIDLHYDNTPSPNGGTPSSTSSSVVTDLANNQTAINPNLRPEWAAPQNLGSSLALALSTGTSLSGLSGTNSGGFSIPSLSGLTAGVSSSAMIGQQLQAAGISLTTRAVGQIAGSIVGGVAQGLGPNGKTIIGLAAAAITNPSATLRTVENMAVSYATGVAAGALQNALTPITAGIQSSISGFIGDNITTPISTAFGDASNYLVGQYNQLSPDFVGPPY